MSVLVIIDTTSMDLEPRKNCEILSTIKFGLQKPHTYLHIHSIKEGQKQQSRWLDAQRETKFHPKCRGVVTEIPPQITEILIQ